MLDQINSVADDQPQQRKPKIHGNFAVAFYKMADTLRFDYTPAFDFPDEDHSQQQVFAFNLAKTLIGKIRVIDVDVAVQTLKRFWRGLSKDRSRDRPPSLETARLLEAQLLKCDEKEWGNMQVFLIFEILYNLPEHEVLLNGSWFSERTVNLLFGVPCRRFPIPRGE